MEWWHVIAIGILVGAGMLLRKLTLAYGRVVRSIRDDPWELEPIDPNDEDAMAHLVEPGEWAESRDFEFIGAFTVRGSAMHGSLVGAWCHPREGLCFACYDAGPNRNCDLVTAFGRERDAALTTSDAPTAMIRRVRHPHYRQAFAGLSHDERLARHNEGVERLVPLLGEPEPLEPDDFQRYFVDACRREAQRTTRAAAWRLRGVWGALVGWRFLANRPVHVPRAAAHAAG